jgi:putative phosphoesterase
MQVALVADTHIPSRAEAIPDGARARMRSADHVIHAGDFDSSKALADIERLAESLTAVEGNMDPHGLGLPAVSTVELGGVGFVVTHGTGSRRGYEQRVAGMVADHDSPGPTVGVSGHTHEPLDTTVDGYRLLNPGSVTGAAPADEATMMTVDVADGDLDVALYRV